MTSRNNNTLDYSIRLGKVIENIDKKSWVKLHKILLNAWKAETRVFVLGNGGNLGNALHFETDWSKGLYLATGQSIKTLTIGSNSLMQSAFENDVGHENAMANQIQMLGQEGDILLCLSAGGTSENIHRAALSAKKMNMVVLGIFGSKAKNMNLSFFHTVLLIDSNDIMIIEDVTAVFGHSVKAYIEKSSKAVGRK